MRTSRDTFENFTPLIVHIQGILYIRQVFTFGISRIGAILLKSSAPGGRCIDDIFEGEH